MGVNKNQRRKKIKLLAKNDGKKNVRKLKLKKNLT